MDSLYVSVSAPPFGVAAIGCHYGAGRTVIYKYLSKTKRMRGGEACQEHQIRELKKPENYMLLE